MQSFHSLSKAEMRVMIELATCNSYKEIAQSLGLSINTVKKHLKNIYRKTGATNRKAAIQLYLERNIPVVVEAGLTAG